MAGNDQVIQMDVMMLEANPLQPRGLITPESLAELAESIREHGILEPLVVAKTPAGYQIIAGERRWRAAKLAGLTKVPVMIYETTPQGMLEMAIVENVQRQDLNPLERAQAYRRLMDEFGLTNSEIAQRVGKSPAYISNSIRLLSLPDSLKDAIMSDQTTEGHVRALSSLEDPRLIVEGYKEVLKKDLSVRATEELVRRMRSQHGILAKRSAPIHKMHILSEEVEKVRDDLIKTLSFNGKQAGVKYILTNSQAKLEINLPGRAEETAPLIRKISEILSGFLHSS